jgi:hypothetical protein
MKISTGLGFNYLLHVTDNSLNTKPIALLNKYIQQITANISINFHLFTKEPDTLCVKMNLIHF